LQSELDASFKRALPLLQGGAVPSSQLQDAKKILIACSLTYVASSFVSLLNIWPWLGRGGALTGLSRQTGLTAISAYPAHRESQSGVDPQQVRKTRRVRVQTSSGGASDILIRGLGKPLIRTWLRLRRQLG